MSLRHTRLLPTLGRALAAMALAAALQPRPSEEARAQTPAPSEARRAEDLRAWPDPTHCHAVLVGVEGYSSDRIPDFKGATGDAIVFASALQNYAGFDPERIMLLSSGTRDAPTRQNILAALAELRGKIPADGLLVFSFSGRAVESEGRSYLLPADAAVSRNLAVLEESAIRAELLKEMIEATGAGQVLLLLDAYRPEGPPAAKPMLSLTQRFQQSFNFDLRKQKVRAYATIFAARPGQNSYLRIVDSWGLFARTFYDGLRSEVAGAQGQVTLAGLVGYLQHVVPNAAESFGLGRQQPTAYIEGYRPEQLVISRRPMGPRAAATGPTAAGPTAAGPTAATGPTAPAATQPQSAASQVGDRALSLSLRQPYLEVSALAYSHENRKAVERQSWEVIRASRNPHDYKAFFTNYPDSEFAVAAWLRYDELRSGSSTTLSRFPTVRCSDTVKEGGELGVTVQLTRDLRTPDVVVSDSPTPAVGLSGQDDGRAWVVEVVLHADGFSIEGENIKRVSLRKDTDSTKALFRLKANPVEGARQARSIEVEFWQNDTIVATGTKAVTVLGEATDAGALKVAPPSSQSTKGAPRSGGGGVAVVNPAPAPPAGEGPSPSSGSQTQPEQTSEAAPETENPEEFKPKDPSVADMTVRIKQVSASSPELFNVRITSPHFSPDSILEEEWDTSGFARLLKENYNALVPLGARGARPARPPGATPGRDAPPSRAKVLMRNFGLELYRRTPFRFKTAFWELSTSLGPKFKSILIVSDDPVIPWELVRPVSGDGREEREYLGMEFQMARWHIEGGNLIKPRVTSTLRIEKIYAIIPSYTGGSALAGQRQEKDELASFEGCVNVPARYEEMEKLFGDLPSGVIHFAGHGVIESGAQQLDEYRIELEGGTRLSLELWKGMTRNRRRNSPLIFFNACDVGATSKVAGFVNGWAPAALNAGASGYIGTLWPVGDVGASEFGVRFYRRLRERARRGYVPVAELLRETRLLFLESDDPTALSYIYYGNHDLVCILTPAAKK